MTSPSATLCDLRGLKCPLPVLRSKKQLARLKRGDELLVWTTDPLAVIDIPHLCNQEGHTLVEQNATNGGHSFLIKKGE